MKIARLINLGVALMMLAAFVPASTGTALAQESNPQGAITRDTPYIPGEILVSFPEGMTTAKYKAQAAALAGQVQAAVVQSYKNLAVLDVGAEADVEAAAVLINNSGLVNYAQPNYIYWVPEREQGILGESLVTSSYQVATDSNGTTLPWDQLKGMISYYQSGKKWKAIASFPLELTAGKQWGWDAIEADLIWTETKASPYVCVLDTGIDTAHPELSGKVVNGYDFVNDDRVPNDDNGHGTHVAGIIAAKTNYNPKGDTDSVMGVSNYKVYNVKVMNSQGYGSSYSIAAGLTYCGNLSAVKVINMSLGSYTEDQMIWNAVKKALLGKTRVLVAAAGNDSTSEPFYPAAWSAFNGYGDEENTVKDQILAVGAGRSPSDDGTQVWVDVNNDGMVGAVGTEVFEPEQCASGVVDEGTGKVYGSNYGSWVSVVAPGEAIYSTTPISYPFYLNYYEPHVASRYDYLSGTSQAAAFVSGAAARVWSLNPTVTAANANVANIKSYLVDRSDSLSLAATIRDLGNPSLGYANTYEAELNYGDEDDGYIIAPYCWPTVNGDFTSEHSMENSAYLNLAGAMQRTAMLVEVKDASTGLPFETKVPAYVEAKDISATAKGVRRGYARTVAGNEYVALLNLPTDMVVPAGLENAGMMKYAMNVTRKGNTAGLQTFNTVIADPADLRGKLVSPYTFVGELDDTTRYNRVSLPPSTNIQFVLDWYHPGEVVDTTNLDMFLWVPPNNTVVTEYQVVGNGTETAYTTINVIADTNYLGMGTLLDPVKFGGDYSPYAAYLIDGGEVLYDQLGQLMGPTESIVAKVGTAIKLAPYSKMKYDGVYHLTVTDYTADILTKDPYVDFFSAPIVRAWVKGKIVESVSLQDSASGCYGTEGWWQVLTYQNSGTSAIVTEVNTCNNDNNPTQ